METAAFKSPIGWVLISGTDTTITKVDFVEVAPENTDSKLPMLNKCKLQLEEYFAGNRKEFELNLSPNGTDFQKKVWNELQNIPFGKTISYMDQSKKMGDPKAIRAVASANGKNPIAVIIPCHRVIGSSGDLTGYASGIHRKKWLLELESNQGRLF